MDYFQSTGATIMSFLPYSGGKFLSNCLSLSRGGCPQDPTAARYLIKNPEDYDYRLHTVMRTIPPVAEMQSWRQFEFGDMAIYGTAFLSWLQGVAQEPETIVESLCNSGMRFFITDHSMDPSKLLIVWPKATVIKVINSSRFQRLAWLKKNANGDINFPQDMNGNFCMEKYQALAGPDWPDWQDFEQQAHDITKFDHMDNMMKGEIQQFYHRPLCCNKVLLFDMDSCIFDQDQFLTAMASLYQHLELDDFNSDLIKVFYTKYIELHV
jgi:hypothetical protein